MRGNPTEVHVADRLALDPSTISGPQLSNLAREVHVGQLNAHVVHSVTPGPRGRILLACKSSICRYIRSNSGDGVPPYNRR